MSMSFSFICQNSLEEIRDKVADICIDISTENNQKYFSFEKEDGVYRSISITEDVIDCKYTYDLSELKRFNEAILLYKKKILKDDINNYRIFNVYIHVDFKFVNYFLSRLNDVNIMINFPKIIVFDQIRDQVIKSNYQLDWYWNDKDFSIPLPDDWEEKFDEMLAEEGFL